MFNKQDLEAYRMFKAMVGESKVELKGKAVCAASLAFEWFDKLEKRIIDDLQEKEKETNKTKG